MAKTTKPRISPKAAPAEGGDTDVLQEDTGTALITVTEKDRPAEILLRFKDDALKIITEKKEEYAKLTIAGIGDKDGYNAVKAAMGEMKNSRLVFARAAEEHITAPMKAIVEEVNKGLNAIIDGFKEVEGDLRKKKDAIDDEKDRLKEEERLAAIKRVQERTVKLVELGATSDGMVYSFYYSQLLYITAKDVQDWEDERFAEFMAEVRVEFDKEAERKRQAEATRIDEENERLIKQAELEKLSETQAEENKQLRLRIGNLRRKELKMLGGVVGEDDTFFFPGKPFQLPIIDMLIDMPDAEWEALVESIENYKAPVEEQAEDDPGNFAEIASEAQGTNQSETEARTYPLTPEDVYPAGDKPTVLDSKLPVFDPENDLFDGLVEITLQFFNSQPYSDIAITPRRTMRFFPDDFADQANDGVEPLANYKVQELNCIIFDNIQ